MIINSLKLRENLFSPECNKPPFNPSEYNYCSYTACSRRQTQDTNSVLGFRVHLVHFSRSMHPENQQVKTGAPDYE